MLNEKLEIIKCNILEEEGEVEKGEKNTKQQYLKNLDERVMTIQS